MTKSQRMRESAVMISSTMPSAKYSCSGSPLMLAKGSTAIDGLSGSGNGAPPPPPPPPPPPATPSPHPGAGGGPRRFGGGGGGVGANPVDPHWAGYVLDLL